MYGDRGSIFGHPNESSTSGYIFESISKYTRICMACEKAIYTYGYSANRERSYEKRGLLSLVSVVRLYVLFQYLIYFDRVHYYLLPFPIRPSVSSALRRSWKGPSTMVRPPTCGRPRLFFSPCWPDSRLLSSTQLR